MAAVEHAVDVRLGAASFKSVPDMWHHRVHSTPESEALFRREGDRFVPMTWREAGALVKAVANGLLGQGLRPEERCVLLAATSVDWIVADLGILCAGGATTTVYPTSTPDECAYILQDCEAVFVFCDTQAQVDKLLAIRQRIPSVKKVFTFSGKATSDGWVVTFHQFKAEGRAWGEANPDAYRTASSAIEPDHLATLMYTSGTTGEPKGVMLSHDAWVYEGAAIDAMGMISPADKQVLFLPLAHVFAKVMQVLFIRLGVPTVVEGDSTRLGDALALTRPTFVAAVPRTFEKLHARILNGARSAGKAQYAVFRWALGVGREVSRLRQQRREPTGALKLRYTLADRLVLSKVREALGGRLRFFISGGAPLSKEIAEFFHAFDVLILEGYGLTESGAASSVNGPEDFVFGTVGRPLPGCVVRIAPDGEILLRSRGVMRGYHNRPADTAEALWEDGNGQTWLRTGDVGTVLDSGHVVITDRKKEIIVTSGGKNIAPARARDLLKARCPYVAEVLVHGDRRAWCAALVTLDEEAVAGWAREHDISWTDLPDLARKPEVVALVQSGIDAVNAALAPHETLRRFAIVPEQWTVENGALTPSLKVKRRVVEERHASLLDSFYAVAA